jgi:hypothetical protein
MLPTTILTALLLFASGSSGQEKKDTTKQAFLPNNILVALKTKFPKAVIDKQNKENEDGKVVYDIEFKQEGIKFEADIFEDGTINNWEKAVGVSELPAAVTKSVEKKYPKATLKEIMAITQIKKGKETLEGYEIVLNAADKEEYEITVAPDGKILEDSGDEK